MRLAVSIGKTNALWRNIIGSKYQIEAKDWIPTPKGYNRFIASKYQKEVKDWIPILPSCMRIYVFYVFGLDGCVIYKPSNPTGASVICII